MSFTRRPDTWLHLSGPPERSNGTGDTATGDSLSGFVYEAQPPVIVAPVVAISTGRDAARVGSDTAPSARRRRSAGRRRALAAVAMVIAIAAGAASAIIITSLGGSDQPSATVPPPTQAVTPERPPLVLEDPTLPPDPRWKVDAETPDSPSPSSPVAANTNRSVGTSGGRTAASNRGSLAIRSAPQGARVFVNGALVGSTPLVLDDLQAGSRSVRIEADGYEGWSASTNIVANQQTRLSATLARTRR